MDNRVKKVFTPKPMISFCSARKMGGYLVRAKLYAGEKTKGSFKCGSKHCYVCLMLMKHLLLPAQLQLKLKLLNRNLIVMTSA